MNQHAELQMRLGIVVTFECRDSDGNVLKVIHGEGQAWLSEEQDGTDDCERSKESGS